MSLSPPKRTRILLHLVYENCTNEEYLGVVILEMEYYSYGGNSWNIKVKRALNGAYCKNVIHLLKTLML